MNNSNQNPNIGQTVVELIKLRSSVQDALYAYPYPEGDELKGLLRSLRLLTEAERVATKEKNFGV